MPTAKKLTATEKPSQSPKTSLRVSRRWVAVALAALIALGVGIGIVVATSGGGTKDGTAAPTGPYVGGDLHVLTALRDRIYVGGHGGGAVSRDEGRTWTQLPTLNGADPMGAAAIGDTMLIGGHPGLFRSSDGTSFAEVSGQGELGDVHALGSAGDIVYAGTTVRGLLASNDGGASWTARNTEPARMFMGVILVDPANTQRLIAPVMSTGLMTSADGGLSWTALGGPGGAMAAAWDPTNTLRLLAVGMAESALSSDGGKIWTPVTLPKGTATATFSADGTTIYAAAPKGSAAAIYTSTDQGKTWKALT
ncbi:UNVERIFIED_ORG: photosystem II stability/assembly factor-like uncharacterized protein [Arthrobacter sp. UYCu721]